MKTTQTALITGATSGIGLELALLFAEQGYNLVIVARNEQKLAETASRLKAAGASDVLEISADLSYPDGPQQVYDEVKRNNRQIHVLVNDAGAGEYGAFAETSLEEELAIIQLNIASLVHLTKLVLRDMLERNEGKILQLASIASYQPTPLLAVYAATKAFVLSFTDALINELKDTNVTMTALIPGATDTDFFIRAHAENTKAAQQKDNPAEVAKVGFEALMKGEPHAIAKGMRSQIVMSSLFSNQRVAAMARKQMEQVENGNGHHHNGNGNPMQEAGFHGLFMKELKDIYWAEKALIQAIPKMKENTSSPELIAAFDKHLTETYEHAVRLERVFRVMGQNAVPETCEAMKGLLKEAEELMNKLPKGFVRDAAIISAAQKIEHYEIASYGTLLAFAMQLEKPEVMSLLEATLDEEKGADQKLTEIAESYVNEEAADGE